MKIVAPVSSPREVEMLLHFGADELYCGVATPEWEEHFGGRWWMNRRSPVGANLASWEEIRDVVELARPAKIPVHVTLNAPFYTESGMRYLLKLAERLSSELAVDGFIVSDVNFLMQLTEAELPARIHLSSLGACTNSWAVWFYASLGVDRIILPRQLRGTEIEGIVTKSRSRMEFEVFAVNDGCYFEEGFCQTTHVLGGPFCLTEWEVQVQGKGKGRIPLPEEIDRLRQDLREYLWYQNNCGSSFQHRGLPNGPCSLCWFGHFRDWGVTSVKVIGREASFVRKMASLQLVRAVVDKAMEGTSREEVASFARSLRDTPDYCDKGYMCYFRGP
jgi:putative protease